MGSITLPSGREIGKGAPVFIIAEIGSNWKTLDDARMSIRAAKNCGADAVKFQAYTHEALYGSSRMEIVEIGPPVCTTIAGQLPLEWLPELKFEAEKAGIEFLCSAFSPELVEAVNPFVNVHKVASAEITHLRLLQAIAKTGKPVILSTGASGRADVAEAFKCINPAQAILLYCVAAYPAPLVDLRNIRDLHKTFSIPVGFSDHSTDVMELVQNAVLREGACVLEKHVNFTEHEDTPDAEHSLSEFEFKLYVKAARREEIPLQTITPHENEMVAKHNRRLIATKDIGEGEILKEGENFGIYRSLKDNIHAFHPAMVDAVNGRVAKIPIPAGHGIGPEQV